MMDSSEVVIPRKIGACAATRAVVLLYTDAGGTKIRKRIMPIRTLGWLGVAACARSLVGSHSRYLAGVPIDQIEELVNKLLAPIQIEANAFVSSSAQLHLSEGSEDEDQTIWPAHVQMSEPASITALPRADAIETGTPPHAIATKDPESENVVEFEDEELQGDDALLELFMRCDVFEPPVRAGRKAALPSDACAFYTQKGDCLFYTVRARVWGERCTHRYMLLAELCARLVAPHTAPWAMHMLPLPCDSVKPSSISIC